MKSPYLIGAFFEYCGNIIFYLLTFLHVYIDVKIVYHCKSCAVVAGRGGAAPAPPSDAGCCWSPAWPGPGQPTADMFYTEFKY